MGKNFKTVQYPLLAATARPCPTTCSPQATGFVRSVPVRQILHASVIRPQCGKPRENEHRAPTRPTMAAMLRLTKSSLGRLIRRSLGDIRSQVVVPAPRSHFEEFFGWQTMQPSQPPSTPRTCCLGRSLFEAKSPYDTRPSAKLEEVLDMLTSCEKGARRWSTGAFPTATHQAQGFIISNVNKPPTPCY